eukprot:SAG11_NODE_2806_length_2950_cov_9.723957_2_plen_132_part_00
MPSFTPPVDSTTQTGGPIPRFHSVLVAITIRIPNFQLTKAAVGARRALFKEIYTLVDDNVDISAADDNTIGTLAVRCATFARKRAREMEAQDIAGGAVAQDTAGGVGAQNTADTQGAMQIVEPKYKYTVLY